MLFRRIKEKRKANQAVKQLIEKGDEEGVFSLAELIHCAGNAHFEIIEEVKRLEKGKGILPTKNNIYITELSGIKINPITLAISKSSLRIASDTLKEKFPNIKFQEITKLTKDTLLVTKFLNDILAVINMADGDFAKEVGKCFHEQILSKYSNIEESPEEIEELIEEGHQRKSSTTPLQTMNISKYYEEAPEEVLESEEKEENEEERNLMAIEVERETIHESEFKIVKQADHILSEFNQEKLSIGPSTYIELRKLVTKPTEKTRRYTINKDLLPSHLKKTFNKPKSPYRVSFLMPGWRNWKNGLLVYNNSCFYFYLKEQDFFSNEALYNFVYPTFNAEFALFDGQNPYIEICRKCDREALKIKISSAVEGMNEVIMGKEFVTDSLEYLFFNLSYASLTHPMLESDEIDEDCGLVALNINRISLPDNMARGDPNLKNIYLQLFCYPFTITMKIGGVEDDYSINKTIFMPLNNWFKKIKISVFSSKETRVLLPKKTKELASGFILNYDILSTGFGIEKEEMVSLNATSQKMFLDMKFTNLSNLKSYIQNPNSKKCIEGKLMKSDLNSTKQETDIALFRIRRIFNYIEIGKKEAFSIVRFKFPYLSYAVLALLHILIYFFNGQYIIFYLIIAALLFSLSQHSSSHVYIELLKSKLMNPKDINPYYIDTLVNTKKYYRTHRYTQLELLRNKLVAAQGMLDKIKFFYKGFSQIPYKAHTIANLVEKNKNLLCWHDENKTKVMLSFLGAMFVILLIVPLKVFVFLGLWGLIIKSRHFYMKHYEKNRTRATRVILGILRQKMPEKYVLLKDSLDKPYPFLAKSKELEAFNQKLVKYVVKYLDIELSMDTVNGITNLHDLIILLSSTEEKLDLLVPLQGVSLEDLRYKYPKVVVAILAFINTTPSDFFIVLNKDI